MRFLADENMVVALRAAGHDLVSMSEVAPRAPDPAVLARADDEDRILLTSDKDFGELVYRLHGLHRGVVLFRYPSVFLDRMIQDFLAYLGSAPDLSNAYAVLQPGRVRVRRRKR